MIKVVAFLDSCVLYPFSLRDILMQFFVEKMFQAKWSTQVRMEVIHNVEKNNPAAKGKLGRTFDLMEKVVPDFLATFSDETLSNVKESSTDTKDAGILAAAIDSGCTHLITSNLKHFDIAFASARGVSVIHPDEFLAGLIANNESLAKIGFESVIARCKKPPRTKQDYCKAFKDNHLPKTANALAAL